MSRFENIFPFPHPSHSQPKIYSNNVSHSTKLAKSFIEMKSFISARKFRGKSWHLLADAHSHQSQKVLSSECCARARARSVCAVCRPFKFDPFGSRPGKNHSNKGELVARGEGARRGREAADAIPVVHGEGAGCRSASAWRAGRASAARDKVAEAGAWAGRETGDVTLNRIRGKCGRHAASAGRVGRAS